MDVLEWAHRIVVIHRYILSRCMMADVLGADAS